MMHILAYMIKDTFASRFVWLIWTFRYISNLFYLYNNNDR